MARVTRKRMRQCDWTDKDQVIALAEEMGGNLTVYKHPERKNYNITHTFVRGFSHPRILEEGCIVIHRVGRKHV